MNPDQIEKRKHLAAQRRKWRDPEDPPTDAKTLRAAWVCYTIVIVLALVLAALPAFAHSWYSEACCSGEDCAPIARDRVTWTKTGWRVELRAGDHPMLTGADGFVEVIPFDEALPSMDSDFHACVNRPSPGWQQIERVICLYVPMGDVGA